MDFQNHHCPKSAIHGTRPPRSPGNEVAIVQFAESTERAFRRPTPLRANVGSVLLLARSEWAAEMRGVVARDMEFSAREPGALLSIG